MKQLMDDFGRRLFAGDATIMPALESNRALSSNFAQPSKISASGRSDSSSAIQHQETQEKWNKVL
jgi:hypothetical protein